MRTFPTRFPTLTVDHIFVNEAIQPLSVTLHRSALARIASDHFPLVAEFVLSLTLPPNRPARSFPGGNHVIAHIRSPLAGRRVSSTSLNLRITK